MSSDEIVVAIAIFCFGSAQAVHTMSELMSGLKNAKRSKLCAQGGFDENPVGAIIFEVPLLLQSIDS